MAQQPQSSKGLLSHPFSQFPRSLMNFPVLRFPALWEDLEEEWGALASQQNMSISEDDKHIYVEAALPGLNPKEIDVTIDKGILRIQGEKKEEETKNKKIHCRAVRSYSYRIALPQLIDEKSDPSASYKDGILSLTFAKASAAQTRKITIQGA